ncbi:hypothetical protein StoSoilB19_03640 [Arthrobacter sp. StoSoilB19]|nr:hypothetical protein StoSoilB19_03640 [Arthrobacter sp. StoSoilB19]
MPAGGKPRGQANTNGDEEQRCPAEKFTIGYLRVQPGPARARPARQRTGTAASRSRTPPRPEPNKSWPCWPS